MKRGFGIGLLLLASALLLVTIGVTLNVQGSMNSLLAMEYILFILISIAIFGLLLADKKWNFSHVIVLIIAILGFIFGIKGFFVVATSIELLALISLDLLGFVLSVFMVTSRAAHKPVVRKQQTLETYEEAPTSVVYDTKKVSKKTTKKKATKKKTTKKKAAKKKTTKKTSKNLEL